MMDECNSVKEQKPALHDELFYFQSAECNRSCRSLTDEQVDKWVIT